MRSTWEDASTEPHAVQAMAPLVSRCPFLELPSDLLLTLADWMDPASQVLLSFTCHALYNALHLVGAKKVQGLAPSAYDDYLVGMVCGLNLHDKFACLCHRLHKTELHDIPGVTRGLAWNGCWPSNAKIGNFSKYCLHQRHVQLALRHSSTGARRRELLKLMRPYRDSGNSVFNPMSWEFRAQPVIADGSFMLHTTETFQPLYNSDMTMGQCQFLEVCPHVVTSPRWATDTSHLLLRRVLEQVIDRPGSKSDGYCLQCATDFSIVSTDCGLQLDVWYDFGSSPSASSIWWKTHVAYYLDDESEDDVSTFQQLCLSAPGERNLQQKFETAMRDMQL